MKKYIALLLALSALTFPGCSSSEHEETDETNENETFAETDADEPETESVPETSLPVPEDVEVINFDILELEGEPVYDNGEMVLYFTDSNIMYDENTVANIGVVANDEAYTVKAEIDFDSYPDMKTENGTYRGIALKPVFEIDPGSYRISITFDEYKVEFNMTIG